MSKAHEKTAVERFCEDPEQLRLYKRERLGLAVSTAILGAMEEQQVSPADMARHLGCSERRVRQILQCRPSMRLSMLSDILTVLGLDLVVRVKPLEVP